MNYTPRHAVWEITYGCNMRCKHCGSGCGEKYPNELDTDEALALCDDLSGLGLKVLTLSGGEPFLRKDWPIIAKRLTDGGVTTNAISNGWFINEKLVETAIEAGLVNMAVSLDGLPETHDFFRMKGSYSRVMSAIDILKKMNMPTTVCTNINKRNLTELRAIKEILNEKKVDSWQIQITRPMGNFSDQRDLVISPDDLCSIIDFAYETMLEGKVVMNLGDDIGYFGIKDTEIRKRYSIDSNSIINWIGCQAGKGVIGIRSNGDITGCLSIRDDSFLEGNIRDIPLPEMWNSKDKFVWNRKMTRSKLTGFCAKCQYANCCMGGCSGSKTIMCGTLYENRYCAYRVIIERQLEKIGRIGDADECIRNAKMCIEKKSFQLADAYFSRALTLKPDDRYIIDMLGYTNFFLENYSVSKEYNEKALVLDPKDSYACKGLGLCLAKLGEVEKGISCIMKAIKLAGNDFTDYYMDLAVVLEENNQTRKAVKVLDQVRKHSKPFAESSEKYYCYLKNKLSRES